MGVESAGRTAFRLRSCGKLFANGLSNAYEFRYDSQLEGVVSEEELLDVVMQFNETIQSYWPCDSCFYFGYVCLPLTLGLSILLPHICISEAERYAAVYLENVNNRPTFYDREIRFAIRKTCCASYLELSYPSSLKQELALVPQ